ncbi:hypothetical protein JCM11641_008174 [Rhodosporidiobolus odoratus]
MAPPSTGSSSSDTASNDPQHDAPVYLNSNNTDANNKLATSLAGLPVRVPGQQDGLENPNGQPKQEPKGLRDTLDLATGSPSPADIAAKLEQKRLEHERQRALQKKAFEEQMKQLELQQQMEEQALMASTDGNGGAKSTGPVRSRSGNDLASFNAPTAADKYAAAKSMPGSRRHSGELPDSAAKEGAAGPRGPDGVRRGLPNGQQRDAEGKPMLNSFLFDDELDADLQNSAWGGRYLQMNTDDDRFPVLLRHGAAGMLSASSAALDLAPLSHNPTGEWPAFVPGAAGTPQPVVSAGAPSAPATPAMGVSPGGRSSALPAPARSERSSPNGGGQGKSNGVQMGSGAVDALGDQFSQFSIDTKVFSPSPSGVDVGGVSSLATPFLATPGAGGYVHDHGAFVYGGPQGAPGGARSDGGMGANRFAGLRLEDLQGDMLPLCKDQFGCRYLQKKLEDGNPEHRDMIYNEIFPHFAELMTDPFANYLAQRLLEFATDEQRDALIESISGELVTISLNMHGTRAVQKMIDYLSTQRQVQSLILALNLNVVTLIKDLNGNHVIQKCLNALPPEDNQFIYNAVATHCIEVATHRHGCCVLQRCIDHASESQRIQLVTEITYNSLTLVQDAFGNYVVQYVLDLNDNRFIEAIVRQFLGNVSALSAQKFSSNVVEKCIRVADATGRRAIIDELLVKNRLERLLRDSFANYVVQTALDYAEPAQRAQLIETIRPILPMIRNTPYGKRIQSKIQRETNDHMRHSGGYHGGGGGGHQHFVPGGHFYGHPGSMHGPPHPQYYGGMHHAPPPPPPHFGGADPYARGASPYGMPHMQGYPPQGMPPQGMPPMGHGHAHGTPQQMHQAVNGVGQPQQQGQQGFAPFPGQVQAGHGGGVEGYSQPPHAGQGMAAAGGYSGFM